MTKNTILFDLDGTLVDTAADLAWALNQAISPIDRRQISVDEVKGMIGGGIANLVKLGLNATGGDIEQSQFQLIVENCKTLYNDHIADNSRPYPGVVEALKELSNINIKMGVCTNKPELAAKKLLSSLSLDSWLPTVIGGDSLPIKKPNPRMAIELLGLLNSDNKQAIIVGDSITDIELAKAADIPVVLVNYGYSKDPVESLGAHKVISSFGSLPDILTSI